MIEVSASMLGGLSFSKFFCGQGAAPRRSESKAEFGNEREVQPRPKLGAWIGALERMLATNETRVAYQEVITARWRLATREP
jgi:hypothetical protein